MKGYLGVSHTWHRPDAHPKGAAPEVPSFTSEAQYADLTFLRVERWDGARWRPYTTKLGPTRDVNRFATTYMNAWYPPYYWIEIWDMVVEESGYSFWQLVFSQGNSRWEQPGPGA